MTLAPTSLEQLAQAVRDTPRVLPVGGGTKPRLARADDGAVPLSTRALSGIVEYDPSEFTFTALAGTRVREIASTLADRGQYLPFDPLLLDAGATLGGTVASGLSGPGRFRYGSVRDFILGVRFVDGSGRLLRMGGKVVKNAAGFDLPKFFVGSMGRFGVLGEITFKVFPRAAAFRTIRIPASTVREISETIIAASNTRWEVDALDASPQSDAVYLRIGGPLVALEALSREILARFPSGACLEEREANEYWTSVREFRWAKSYHALLKIAVTPKRLTGVCEVATHAGAEAVHISAGGNVVYVSLPERPSRFDEDLLRLGLSGITLRGSGALRLGTHPQMQVEAAVKAALDPQARFPSF